jgi:hypothetical protein
VKSEDATLGFDSCLGGRDLGFFPKKGQRNCRSLGSPGFPVKSCGFDQLHVVLFGENHTSDAVESGEVGNPGTLGMTKERATLYGKWFLNRRRFSSPWVGRRLVTLPVEITILLENTKHRFQATLSSRPERSVVERSAVFNFDR